MVYTKRGPFVDASPTGPYLDAGFFNTLEAALQDATSGLTYLTGTGVAATDTPALTAAITAAQAAQRDLILSGTFLLTTGITWNIARGSLLAVGNTTLNFTALTTGPALTVTGPATGHRSATFRIGGFQMLGPNTDASTVDAVLFTDTNGVDQFTFEHAIISGFRDGFTYGNNVWSVEHRKVYVAGCHRYGINLSTGTNAGESLVFIGCSLAGTHNTAGTGIALYSPPTGSTVDARFLGGSFDYNDQAFDLNGHGATFTDVHFEDAAVTTPIGRISYTGGQVPTNINLTDCSFSPTEMVRSLSTTGRPTLFEVKAGSGGRVNFTVSGGWGGSYDSSTQFFTDNSGGAAPNVSITGLNFDVGGVTRVTQYGDYLNLLANGTMESTSTNANGLGGWSLPATNTAYYGGSFHSGTQSLRMVSAGSTAFTVNAFQVAAITPRGLLSLTGYLNIINFAGGSAAFSIQFLAADRSTVISTTTVTTLTANQGWVGVQRRLMAPAGAAYASVQLSTSSFVGNLHLDDVQLVAL